MLSADNNNNPLVLEYTWQGACRITRPTQGFVADNISIYYWEMSFIFFFKSIWIPHKIQLDLDGVESSSPFACFCFLQHESRGRIIAVGPLLHCAHSSQHSTKMAEPPTNGTQLVPLWAGFSVGQAGQDKAPMIEQPSPGLLLVWLQHCCLKAAWSSLFCCWNGVTIMLETFELSMTILVGFVTFLHARDSKLGFW